MQRVRHEAAACFHFVRTPTSNTEPTLSIGIRVCVWVRDCVCITSRSHRQRIVQSTESVLRRVCESDTRFALSLQIIDFYFGVTNRMWENTETHMWLVAPTAWTLHPIKHRRDEMFNWMNFRERQPVIRGVNGHRRRLVIDLCLGEIASFLTTNVRTLWTPLRCVTSWLALDITDWWKLT